MNSAIDLQKYIEQRDIDARIKESRADLLHIMQSEHRRLESRMDNLDKRMDGLDKRMDGLSQDVKDLRNDLFSTKKWIIGLLITIVIGFTALIVPPLISAFFL